MKRASVLRACAIVGTALSVLACSGSNPTVPPGVVPSDASLSERGLAQIPDTASPVTEAGVLDDGSPIALKDALIPSARDGATDATDVPPASKVTVTIEDPSAMSGVDGGSGDDGGNSRAPIISKTDRLAPTVRVEVQSQGGDPTLDVVTQVKATLVSVSAAAAGPTINLNQTQYQIVPESNSKVYLYANTPFDLSGLAGDFYDLQVTATTAGHAVGTDTVRLYIDGGPLITFLQPVDQVYVKGSVVVTAMILDNRSGVAGIDDTAAPCGAVAGVAFSIGQYEIKPADMLTNGSQYSTTIDFGSYNPPLDGYQMVTVSATNGNGNTSLASRTFTIDNTGPVISAPKPGSGELIGKIINIEATVQDPAGVMDSSVIAVVANGDIHFEVNLVKDPKGGGHYAQVFDTTQLPIYAIFPSISFRAQDMLGNESSVGYLVSLDNTPPVLDLDPPANFRLIRKDGTCSWPFDPVGPDAIDDGSVVTQLFDIRARIEDMGNTPLTGMADFIPIAAVDPASVKVLILDDTSQALVVDTSDPPDGFCDDINPDLVPSVSPQSSKDAQLVDMVPMAFNTGSGDFTYEPGSACSGHDDNPPPALCDTTYSIPKGQAMTYLLGYVQKSLPSIWTIPPIVNDGLQCAGRQFDASNNLRDGWACVAVVASDKVGNKQVSRPIRICVVGQPGSTACTAAAANGADIASVSLPADSSSGVLVTTKAPVLGRGGAAVVAGDTLVFSNVSPPAIASIHGNHIATPQGSSGTQFLLSDVATAPIDLWWPNPDPNAKNPVAVAGSNYFKFPAPVGLIFQDGAAIQVTGAGLDAVIGPVFLLTNEAQPKNGDRLWSIDNVQSTGFSLTGTNVKLSGSATASSVLPDCTGTVVKGTSGSTVDGTKPCKPWSSFPPIEYLEL